MDIDDIKQNLRGYIVQRFTVPADDVEFTDDVHLFDYGYVDSFGAVELVLTEGSVITQGTRAILRAGCDGVSGSDGDGGEGMIDPDVISVSKFE